MANRTSLKGMSLLLVAAIVLFARTAVAQNATDKCRPAQVIPLASGSEPIANAVFLRSRAGKEEELARRLEELVLTSRSDAGVMVYDLHRSPADPGSWFLYERYESQEHFNRHRENPVLQRFVADASMLLDGRLDVRTFKVIANMHGA